MAKSLILLESRGQKGGESMDVFDSLLETLAKHKSEVLNVSYALFLERQKPEHKIDYQKIEKLAWQKQNALMQYGESCNVTGRTMSYFRINREIHDYIKSKGHVPRRIYGFPFYIAVFFSAVPLLVLVTTERGFVLLPILLLSLPFWVWWFRSETFEPKLLK
jgi:hypothetical protein